MADRRGITPKGGSGMICLISLILEKVVSPSLCQSASRSSVLVLRFSKGAELCTFSEVKIAPWCSFLEMKNAPCPFSTINRARKWDSCQKSRNLTWKMSIRENSCLQKYQTTPILSLDGETFKERGEELLISRLCIDHCIFIREISNKDALQHLFQNCSLFQQKRLISPPTEILFLHRETFTKRSVWLLMSWSEFCINCCRIMRGILQQCKGSLKDLFLTPPPLLMKTADFTINCYFVSYGMVCRF